MNSMSTLLEQYYSNVRNDVIAMIRPGSCFPIAVELGCGNGATLSQLKKLNIAKSVYGFEKVDIFKDSFASNIDHYQVCDIEKELPNHISSADLVLLLDVLEHLIDPWKFLEILISKMKSGSVLIISTPNINNIRILRNLILRDEWIYTSSGILDQTHLRFFTETSLKRFLQTLNINIKNFEVNWEDTPFISFFKRLPIIKKFFVCQIKFLIEIK
jgi:SAM-dependent methyltransferase